MQDSLGFLISIPKQCGGITRNLPIENLLDFPHESDPVVGSVFAGLGHEPQKLDSSSKYSVGQSELYTYKQATKKLRVHLTRH